MTYATQENNKAAKIASAAFSTYVSDIILSRNLAFEGDTLYISPSCHAHTRSDDMAPEEDVLYQREYLLVTSCKFRHLGCMTNPGRNWRLHHQTCIYRHVACFDWHQGPCGWTGSLVQLYDHVVKQGCAEVRLGQKPGYKSCGVTICFLFQLIDAPTPNSYRAVVVYNGTLGAVYRSTKQVTWKPFVMFNQHWHTHRVYLSVHRVPDPGALWYLTVRTYSHRHIAVLLQVFKSVRSGKCKPVHTFQGLAHTHFLEWDQVLVTGQYMTLTDIQVKNLNEGDMMFEFKITLAMEKSK